MLHLAAALGETQESALRSDESERCDAVQAGFGERFLPRFK
jgi:hypothetical protein